MSSKKAIKRIFVFCLSIVLTVSVLSTVAFAAGKDDGVIFTTNINGKQYLGTEKTEFCTEYVSANGNGKKFYRYLNADVNSNAITDICDLVAIHNAIIGNGKGIDFTFDSVLDSKDIDVVRQFILGTTDFEIK